MSLVSFLRHAIYEADQFLARYQVKEKTRERVSKLDPNQNSAVKTETYSWGLSQTIVLGTPCDIEIVGQPDTTLRIESWKSNVPAPGAVIVRHIMTANVGCLWGEAADAFGEHQANWPTLEPCNSLRVYGKYTGHVPMGYVKGESFNLTFEFSGTATIVADGSYSDMHWDPHPDNPAWREETQRQIDEVAKKEVTPPQEL
jgi:hypothetical protein